MRRLGAAIARAAALALIVGVLVQADRPGVTLIAHVAPPNLFSCSQASITATTQCQAAPGASTSIYVTDVWLANGSTTASTLNLVTGTGTNCVTSPVNVTPPIALASNAGAGAFLAFTLQTPLKVTANQAVCCKTAGSTAFSCLVAGYTAP